MSALSSVSTTWKHPHPKGSRVDTFRRHVNRKYGLSIESYEQLHAWSVGKLEDFCREMWDFCGIVHSVAPDRVADGIHALWPRPRWFPGARMNYTENILAPGLSTHPDSIAISACREGGIHWRHLTWPQLRDQVALYASALLEAGIKKGDRVAAVISNSIESVVILLATGAIGAIFSSSAPDMGVGGIVRRYTQIRPRILFVDSEVLYASKRRTLQKKLVAAVGRLRESVPEMDRVVVVTGSTWNDPRCLPLSQFLNVRTRPLKYTQVPFDHPIYILYSSGTTGLPKCICHSGGSALLQQKKEYIFSMNMNADSTYYQYTTTGWMMWNYLVGSLSLGSRIVLYDGSPLHPSPAQQIHLLNSQGVTHWGTSPKLLSTLKHSGYAQSYSLEDLQIVVSAGSPLSPELFRWFYTVFPRQVGLFSGSGGTDLVGGIVNGNPLAEIHEGELASAQLGMKVEVWDSEGRNVAQKGEQGELVITKPFFSQPITFWGDNGDEKYYSAYFDKFAGVWCHGDFIRRNPATGGYVILGRSDGVLNPGGIRFGTAEIYGIVDQFLQVEDCIAVGQRRSSDGDEQVLLFLKMKTGAQFTEAKEGIRMAIRTQLSPRHVPAYIFQVQDIPYTTNGKKVETIVKAIVNKEDTKKTGVVANPECLEEYRKFADLPIWNANSSRL